MLYVYVAPDGNIRLKSKERCFKNWVKGCSEHVVGYEMSDRLIFEDNQIKKYENSKQFWEDINRYHLQKEVRNLKKENKDLVKIANNKVTKELELEVKWQEANAYQRKIYLLKQMRDASKKSMDK